MPDRKGECPRQRKSEHFFNALKINGKGDPWRKPFLNNDRNLNGEMKKSAQKNPEDYSRESEYGVQNDDADNDAEVIENGTESEDEEFIERLSDASKKI